MDILLILLIILIPLLAEIKVKSSYNKYSKVENSKNIKGKDVARMILDRNELNIVTIAEIGGTLSDHYDPRKKHINLSSSIYNDTSVSSIAVAAHECGHAIQDKIGYSFFNLRSALVPLVNITSKISSFVVLLGFILELSNLINIGIILLLCGLFFQLVTLPVEFDASRRAKIQLKELGLIDNADIRGTNSVLNAAALTYVAGFLAEALQILRLVLLSRRRD